MFSAIGRAAIGRIGGSKALGRVNQHIHRVQVSQCGENGLQPNGQGRALVILLSGKRLYSAAATKPAKAASTRATTDKPAKKQLSSTKPTSTKKTTKAKKPVVKKKKGLTEKQQEKKAADAAKAKLRAQKQKERKAVDDDKAKIRELKAKVLTPPKRLPSTAWTVLQAESATVSSGIPLGTVAKEASVRYQSLDASDRERYNQQANENKATNDANYKTWLSSLTPQAVYDSNHAQQRLKQLGSIRSGKQLKIDDPRIPKKPLTPYFHFIKERFTSGDFKGISSVEAVKILSQEYKGLSQTEKKHYEDLSAAQRQEYSKEMAKFRED